MSVNMDHYTFGNSESSSFYIYGSLYHLLSNLMPEGWYIPIYVQLYICDADENILRTLNDVI